VLARNKVAARGVRIEVHRVDPSDPKRVLESRVVARRAASPGEVTP
jgi:hypothetical protein